MCDHTNMEEMQFVVLKINGFDINTLSRDETHQMFLNTNDTLQFEVRRQHQTLKDGNSLRASESRDAEQKPTTDVASTAFKSAKLTTIMWDKEFVVRLDQTTADTADKTTKATQTEEDILFSFQQHIAKEMNGTIIEQEHNLFEQCLAPELDIEEVTLRKSDINERLGLTICDNGCVNLDNMGNTDVEESTTYEVYISGIQPNSVAERDGRLRQGDQILQINGKDVKNKAETEALIVENQNAVTLLVSRYLYTDEDDFNDPSAVDVEDDDEEDEEYYDDNNLAYENCLIANDYINSIDVLDNVLITSETHKSQKNYLKCSNDTPIINTNQMTATSDSKPSTCKKQNESSSKPKLQCGDVFQDVIGLHDHQAVSSRIAKHTATDLDPKNISTTVPEKSSNCNSHVEYDTEHIYETIPEDSESEPFYCSPYESSMYVAAVGLSSTSVALQLQQKQRVAQWLGIKPHTITDIAAASQKQSLSNRKSSTSRSLTNDVSKNKSSTIRSILTNDSTNSGGCSVSNGGECSSNIILSEERENSSSAYNTGGSTNSVTPSGLLLNQNNRFDELRNLDETKQRLNSPKERTTSPKTPFTAVGKGMQGNTDTAYCQKSICANEGQVQLAAIAPNVPKQTTAMQNKQNEQNVNCPYFTAPNLSQYHFVSSQEVSSVQPTPLPITRNKTEEETMVWKVKRRPDGTRYIVRRPARTRVIRERVIRLNSERVRNDLTTTEDDTISEVKIGRYWTKEERKKHMERARERRQQHQCNLDVTANTLLSTLRIGEKHIPKRKNQTHESCLLPSDNLQIPKENSSKTLQYHCQLQFDASKAKTRTSPNLRIKQSSCVLSKLLPSHLHICSVIEDKPIATTPAMPTGTNSDIIPKDGVLDTIPRSTPQSLQTAI